MDLKFRFKNLDNQTGTSQQINNRESNHNSLDKYARKNNNTNSKKTDSFPQKNAGTGINNYLKNNRQKSFRVEKAPQNQFSRYLLDAKNVFYEDRKDLVMYKRYNDCKIVTAIAFFILLFVYLALKLVQPLSINCPPNATCGVFVHCFQGYQYVQADNICVISERLIDQTENMMMKVIENLKYEYGQLQCSQTGETGQNTPHKNIDQLFMGISDPSLRIEVMKKMENYLTNHERQQQIGFQYHSYNKMIIPTKKDYTLGCRINLFFQNKDSRIRLAITFFILCVIWLLVNYVRRYFKDKFLYKQLRKRTLAQNMINISYVKEDLQQKHGAIDESLWKTIDSYRNRDRDIVFLQDDFLYWKAL